MKLAHLARAYLWLALLTGGCTSHHGGSGESTSPPPPPASVAKVTVSPSSLLLQPGGTTQLTATALDAHGATISGVTVTWSSSTDAVTIDANGKVTAGGKVDSAVITASVNSINSAPVPTLVATPNPGVQLIPNDQVVSDPTLVSTTQEPTVGSQLKVTLSGAAPAVGTMIVSSGDKSILGQVVSTAPNGASTDVVYQVAALADVFSELKLNQTFAKDELQQSFDVSPAQTVARTDGAREYDFTLDTSTVTPPSALRHVQAVKAARSKRSVRPAEEIGSVKWSVGPFKCSAKADLSNSLSFKNVQVHVVDNMGPVSASLTVSQGKFDATVSSKGSVQLFVDGEMHFSEGLTGTASCDARLFKYLIPVPPVVALVFIPVVPVIGVRASVTGTLTVGDVVIGLKSQIEQPLTLGFTLTHDGTFTNASSFDGDAQKDFNWTLNQSNPNDLIRFSGDAKAGMYVDVAFTNIPLQLYAALSLSDSDPIKSLIDGFGGFHATLGLASVNDQVQDQTVPAGYALTLLTEIKPGDFVSSFVKFLSTLLSIASIQLPDLKFEPTIFSQPLGAANASLRRFAIGDSVQFQVTLTPDSVDPKFLGTPIVPYNVNRVEIWRKTTPGQSQLVGTDAGVAGANGAAGKNVFKILWKADAAGSTTDSLSASVAANFYAVVVPNFGEDFGFRVGPVLGWLGVIQAGGPHTQEGRRAAVDPDGNLILAVFSGDPLATNPPTPLGGAYAVEILKINPNDETVIWARSIDGPGDEKVNDLTVDAQGNVFATGTALNSPLTADTQLGAAGFSGWAASFGKDGTQHWLIQWQDGIFSTGSSIALGPNRELYVLGSTSAADGNIGGSVLSVLCNNPESGSGQAADDCGDLMLRRIDPNSGATLWTQTDERAGWQIPHGMTIDSGGNVYTAAESFADTQTQNTGVSTDDGYDAFIGSYRETLANGNWSSHFGAAFTMWSSDGQVVWRSNLKLPHQTDQSGNAVYSDENPQGIVATATGLWCMLVTNGASTDFGSNVGGDDSVLLSINPQSGEASPVQRFATTGDDELGLFGPTPSGGMVVTGFTLGSLFGQNAGGVDVVAMLLGADGSPRWKVQFGGPGNDFGIGGAVGPDGNLFLTGYTDGLMPASLSGLPAYVQLNQPAGGEDFFIAKLSGALGTIQSIRPKVH